MLCLYVYNVLPPQRLLGSFEDLLCNGQRKIKETWLKKKERILLAVHRRRMKCFIAGLIKVKSDRQLS